MAIRGRFPAYASIVLLLTLVSTATAKYSGGTGEPNDPYQIATAADLIALGETPEDYDKHFLLTADIDLDPNLPGRKVFDKAVMGSPPSGALSGGDSFTGVFDGRGHKVSHLMIKGRACLGLFGQLASGAEVRDLGVVHVSISGSFDYLGGLVGFNRGTVTQCYSTGTVTGRTGVGALVGVKYSGTVARCYSTGAVAGTSGVGGLVGHNYGGDVTQCYSAGAVSGHEDVGGLVGFNSGAVFDSVWDMETSGQSAGAGGVGLTTAEMMDPYMLGLNGFAGDPNWVLDAGRDYPRLAWEGTPGQVVTKPDMDWLEGGGTSDDPYRIDTAEQLVFLGRTSVVRDKHFILGADIDLSPHPPNVDVFTHAVIPSFAGVFDGHGHTISHLTIKGTGPLGLFGHVASGGEVRDLEMADVSIVGSESYVGGLAGRNDGTVTRCCSTGAVSGTASVVGGLVGSNGTWDINDVSVTNCYSTAAVSGSSQVGGLVGVNYWGRIATCYSSGSVSGWNDVGGLAGENSGFMTSCYSTGTVSVAEPDGQNFGGLVGLNYATVASCHSTGDVSGNDDVGGLVGSNHGDLTQCYSTGVVTGEWGVGGLVGCNPEHMGSSATIAASHSSGAVNGESNVGGLVGSNDGGVTASYSTGEVSGNDCVGGLVGSNHGDLTQCYSIGVVRGEDYYVGGLVGVNYWGRIATCYSSGSVSGWNDVGGLLGNNEGEGDVTQCYSGGSVSGRYDVGGLVGSGIPAAVRDSVWDIEVSGQATSDGGIGKTTAEMQMSSTFLEAGWDFLDETANGTEDIWWILEGKDYPRFVWEQEPARVSFPEDADMDVVRSPVLRWAPGERGLRHDVYFGDDRVALANATVETEGIYRGRHPVEAISYDPGPLEWGKTYYWRIDEVNEADPNSTWKGTVWSFTMSDVPVVSVVDDFERYTYDESRAIWETWKDGLYIDANKPGNGTGSCVGCLGWDEWPIVHGGGQSMPMDYNNVIEAWYSEADRTWETPQDWTVDGADTLTLYFQGEPNNSPEALYVGIEDSAGRMAVVVHPDAEAVLATEWQKWHIALGEVRAAGVDVAAVQKMVIGVGDRKNPKPGGTGRIYIDDIRLTKRMP